MQHHDTRCCIDFFVRLFLDPRRGHQPLRQFFRKYRPEWHVVDMIVLIRDHEIGLLTGIPDALKNVLRILIIPVKRDPILIRGRT